MADALLPAGLALAAVVMAALMYLGIVGRLDRWWIATSAALGVLAVAGALMALMPGSLSPAGPRAQVRGLEARARAGQPPSWVAGSPPPGASVEPSSGAVTPQTIDTVRSMVEVVAELTALSVVRTPRGAPGATYQGPGAQELLALRDRTEETLRAIGTPEPRVQAIRRTLSDAIMRDLEGMLWRAVQRKIGKAATQRRLREIRDDLMRRFSASRPGEAVTTLRPYLQEVGGWNAEVETRLAQVDEFRRTGRLAAAGATPREGARSGS